MTKTEKTWLLYGGGALAIYLLVIRRDPVTGKTWLDNIASQAGSSIVSAPVNFVTGAAAGAVESIGQTFGIPLTDAEKCRQDIAKSDPWNASFDCPAADYLKAFGPKTWFN